MSTESIPSKRKNLTLEERQHLRQVIQEASEPIAPFWPMRTMVAQNPIHGLEYLPFDQAVRKGKDLLGGNGYLPNEEYRLFYREGRITIEGVQRALVRVGPSLDSQDPIKIGNLLLSTRDVWQWHLVLGFEELEPVLLQWELSGGGALQQFRSDLPQESKHRIIQRTIKECEQCRDYTEEAYLTNLWKATLSALDLSDSDREEKASADHESMSLTAQAGEKSSVKIDLPDQQTISDWVERLSGVPLVEQINNQMIKWIAAFVDEGLAGWEMPLRNRGFFRAWLDLAQWDRSGHLLGIHDFRNKIQELSDEPEPTIVWCLERLGLEQSQWKPYLSRALSQLPGWTRYIRWLGEHPLYHAQREHPIDTQQYLAVRLFYEVELTQVVCQSEWGIGGTASELQLYWEERRAEYEDRMGLGSHSIDPTTQVICRDAWRLFHLAQCLEVAPTEMHDLSDSDAQTLVKWLDTFPSDLHGPVWLEALEDSFQEDILGKISAHRGVVKALDIRPRAQLVFCIDVRSESFRRHVEAQGPYETFGFAGFFWHPDQSPGF